MTKRIAFWDNFKGLLIFLVVFGHFIYSYAAKIDTGYVEKLYILIYTFHMPAFVFSTGYFSRSVRARSKESTLKMFLCYIIFNTIMMLFSYVYMGGKLKLLTPYYSYWYILSLICWRLIISSLEKIKYLIPLSIVVTLLIGYWSEFSNSLSIRRTIAFFCFFAAGYLIDKEKLDFFISHRTWKTYITGIISIIAFIPITLYLIKKFDITSKTTLMSTYTDSFDIISRLVLLIIAYFAIVILLMVIPNRDIPFLSQFGKNSLLIYLVHRFITIIFYKELFTWKTYSNIYILYAFIASVITCILLSNASLTKHYNKVIDTAANALLDAENKKGIYLKTFLLICFILFLCLHPISKYI